MSGEMEASGHIWLLKEKSSGTYIQPAESTMKNEL